jgi:hypothetical protein
MHLHITPDWLVLMATVQHMQVRAQQLESSHVLLPAQLQQQRLRALRSVLLMPLLHDTSIGPTHKAASRPAQRSRQQRLVSLQLSSRSPSRSGGNGQQQPRTAPQTVPVLSSSCIHLQQGCTLNQGSSRPSHTAVQHL